MNTSYYDINVVEIGTEAGMMAEEKMLILFNNMAPADLRSIAIVHDGKMLSKEIKAGDEMVIDDQVYKILFVGEKVNETMKDLGHATFHFNNEKSSDLPGTVCLEDKGMPEVNNGSTISFRSI